MSTQEKQKMAGEVKNKGLIGKILVYFVLIFWAFVSLFPVYWMITFSLKDNKEIFGETFPKTTKYLESFPNNSCAEQRNTVNYVHERRM